MDKKQIPIKIPEKKRVMAVRTPSLKETFPGRLEWKKKHYDKPVTSTPVTKSRTSSNTTSSKKQTNRDDIESCFGFDESTDGDDENYSIVISPILKEKDKDKVRVEQGKDIVHFKRIPPGPIFNDLLDRYTHDVPQDPHGVEDEEELHVNLRGIKATYSKIYLKSRPENVDEKVNRRVTRSKSKPGSTTTKRSADTAPITKRLKKPKSTQVVSSKPTVLSRKVKENEADLEKWVAKQNKEFEDISNFPLVLEKSP